MLYSLIVSTLAFLVVRENFGLKSCRVEQLSVVSPQPVNYDADKSERHLQLAERIHKLYQVPLVEAQGIVTAVAVAVKPKEFPSMETVLGLIAVESRFNQFAESSAGAVGYLQLTAKSGYDSSPTLYGNIGNGVQHLRDYFKQFGSKDAALTSFNVGSGNYARGMRVPEYLNKIRLAEAQFKQL